MSDVDSIKNNEELREQEESFDETNVDNQSTENEADGSEDPELEAIKARVRDMEEEAEKLRAMNDEVEKQMSTTAPVALSLEEKMEVDGRSIFVGNVDYSATADDLERHFHGCGSVNRVTILCDKFSGHPKGFAYIEFADKDSVQTATALDQSLFKGRQIQVTAKRTNRPGISTTNRGRGSRGRGRGSFRGYGGYRGGAYRSRGRGRWFPY